MLESIKQFSGFLIVNILVFSACKSSETNPSDSISVGLHKSARLGSGIAVRVDSIQDGRCPTGVNCIWAGEAKVKLLLSNDKDSSTVRLTLGASLNSKRVDSTNVTLTNSVYKVILRGVNPYPTYPATNEPQVAVVQVTKI